MPQNNDRLRYVGAATRRIARGIGLDEILAGLCTASVPTFCDEIFVYLRTPLPVGEERPVSPFLLRLRRADRVSEEWDTSRVSKEWDAEGDVCGDHAGQGDLPVEPGGDLAGVLREVRPVFADLPIARAALRELMGGVGELTIPGSQRTILAPLRGRRRVIGAVVFVRRFRNAFENDDRLVAGALATHSAISIDKALLMDRAVSRIEDLQHAMPVDALPQLPGIRLASRYLPAAETARVGGDWYDVVPLPGSRVALVVGDVAGRSVTSAAIRNHLRVSVRALSKVILPPAELLRHLNTLMQEIFADHMATCLYAIYDPESHRVTIASAGHPPPVLLHPDGHTEVLRVPPGPPIGVGEVGFEAVEMDAPAGATLFLYTDGLIESRLLDAWTGIEKIREKLTSAVQLTGAADPPSLEELCDEALNVLGPGNRDDDIALLAARFGRLT
ncbi:PP2C family protein-serine/threonine phosphatase [Streptomyces rubiginosohelvolus]|uniref:PP2C family protein-serine/threonine phosphatase n=1 Tax=Streptomyces rubiginosohelvolus TaxID=67362 RepID=UPI003711608B